MFEYGMDISTLLEIEENNGQFFDFDSKEPQDLFNILKRYGINSIRLRLWNDPYDESGNPYMAGTCDLPRVIKLAKRAIDHEMNILLDFHYSDFWADPGKQFLPKAWTDYDDLAIKNAIYQYTKDVLLHFKQENIDIKYAQIGNEITNGMCWPNGHLDGTDCKWDNLAMFLKSGISALKEVFPSAKAILHLERSGDNELYRKWLTEITKRKVEFDILGVSYYPYWHGSLQDLEYNLTDIQKSFNKDIMIVETSYGFTLEKHSNSNLVINTQSIEELPSGLEYPISIEGQRDFLNDLFSLSKKINLLGLYYWEPGWLAVPNTNWASYEARVYINETHKSDGNEWSNQGLFDYQGRALVGLKLFNKWKEK